MRSLNLRPWPVPLLVLLATLLFSCNLPQVSAQARLFLDLDLTLLDVYELPSQTFGDTQVGGLSALAYDANRDRFYALSDQHDSPIPPHFYTFQMELADDTSQPQAQPKIKDFALESVTFLKDDRGQPYDSYQFDPEGLALSPQDTLYIASEGINQREVPPSLMEFDRASGQLLRRLPVPDQFQMTIDPQSRRQQQGVQPNRGFEALTIAAAAIDAAREPLRLFTANEAPLIQDLDPDNETEGGRDRLLHYYLSLGQPLVIAEHVYPLEAVPLAFLNGLSDMLALDNAGHFLTLERAVNPFGFQIKLFQASLAGASDSSGLTTLQGDLPGFVPVRKQLLLNLNSLGIPLRNLEGLSFGPHLSGGEQTVLAISDNNLDSTEPTQILLFRLDRSSTP